LQFIVEANKGQFVKLDPGVGKLLGILSLQSLPRRLSLDFRDIFTEGLAFDEVLLTSSKVGLAMSRVLAERLDESNQQTGIEYINLAKLQFDPRVIKLLPQQMMQQHRVLPVAFSNNRLTLAMVNPNNIVALDDVRRVIKGVIIEPVVTSEDDFKRFITSTYAELLRKEEEKQARDQAIKIIELDSSLNRWPALKNKLGEWEKNVHLE